MSALKDWLAGERETLIWIDFADYATEIIANGAAWDSPTTIASLLGQAQALLKSDVVSIDAGRILMGAHYCGDGGNSDNGEDPLATLLACLKDASRIALLAETVDAVAHTVQADLVLQFQGLKKSLISCGADDESAGDFGNLDDAGAAVTDVIRTLADKSLAGVLVTLDEPCSEDEFDALGPVMSAAAHYGLVMVSELTNQASSDEIENPAGDIIVLPQAPQPIGGAVKSGGGLASEFWMGNQAAGDFSLRYGRVAKNAVPEIVLAQRSTV